MNTSSFPTRRAGLAASQTWFDPRDGSIPASLTFAATTCVGTSAARALASRPSPSRATAARGRARAGGGARGAPVGFLGGRFLLPLLGHKGPGFPPPPPPPPGLPPRKTPRSLAAPACSPAAAGPPLSRAERATSTTPV